MVHLNVVVKAYSFVTMLKFCAKLNICPEWKHQDINVYTRPQPDEHILNSNDYVSTNNFGHGGVLKDTKSEINFFYHNNISRPSVIEQVCKALMLV